MIARETAPAAATKDMYHGDANLTHYGPLASGYVESILSTYCRYYKYLIHII